MTIANIAPPPPRVSLDRLTPIEAGLPILARLGLSGHGSAAREVIERAILPLYPSPATFDAVLNDLAGAGYLVISRNGYCRINEAGRKYVEERLGRLLGRDWTDVLSASLVALALGFDATREDVRQYLSRRDTMECAALVCLYGVNGSDAMLPRSDMRAALLRAFVAPPECDLMENPMHNTSRHASLLGAAGLNRGTHRDAEAALLRRSLGLRAEKSSSAVAEALVRRAIVAGMQPHTQNLAQPPVVVQLFGGDQPPLQQQLRGGKDAVAEKTTLQMFAEEVRSLAKTLHTDPFAGRVAIAQVYDAGLAQGLNFGTLDAFKVKIAEAGRAGLLDLERYDIAGPMDSALRERSRTVFGRDERHFIVNEWI